jgi:hypothetical protein
VSEITAFRLAIQAPSLPQLWQNHFAEAMSSLELRLDQTPREPSAVTSADGHSLIWFDTGASAWNWLSRNDGSMTFWGSGDLTIGVSIRRESAGDPGAESQAEIEISVDLPKHDSLNERERYVGAAEALASVVLDECEIVRGLAYDESLFERLVNAHSIPLGDRTRLPEWIAYWNAFRLDSCSAELLSSAERAGGTIELKKSSFVIRFSKWPWEARIDQLVEASKSLLPLIAADRQPDSPQEG